MKQQSEQWHQYRRWRIGASDVPVILGLSPYKTAEELLNQKIKGERSQDSYATLFGKGLESVAREHYEFETGIKVEPKIVTSDEHDWLMASLDGYNETLQLVIEIKRNNKKYHAMAKIGEVPDVYYCQIQFQLFCAKSHLCHYFSFDGKDGVIVPVKADDAYVRKRLPKVEWFYNGLCQHAVNYI